MNVLIADDEPLARERLARLVAELPGYQVSPDMAVNGEQVLELVGQLQPDIVLLDIRMPGLSGIEACRRIVDTVENCRVVMLTSYAEDELLLAAIDAGASGYVLKRIGSDERVRAVERVSQGEGTLDPTMTETIFARVREANKAEDASAFADLTAQELAVLALVAEGLTNRQIAVKLFLGEGTVRNYVSSVLSKINVSNRAEAAIYAVKHNISKVVPPTQDNK